MVTVSPLVDPDPIFNFCSDSDQDKTFYFLFGSRYGSKIEIAILQFYMIFVAQNKFHF